MGQLCGALWKFTLLVVRSFVGTIIKGKDNMREKKKPVECCTRVIYKII